MNTITYFPFGNGPNKSLAIEFHALVGKGVLCIEAGLKGCDTTTSTRFNETFLRALVPTLFGEVLSE